VDNSVVPKTLLAAEDECRRARCFFVGTEHLFLAIVKQGGSQVSRMLAGRGTNLEDAVVRVRRLLHHWEPDENWSGLLQHTQRLRRVAQRAIVLAERESGKLPEAYHYLAALLEDPAGHTARAILGLTPPKRKAQPTQTQQVEEEDSGGLDMTFESESGEVQTSSSGTRKSILEFFGRNLTQLAQDGELSPNIGRERELQLLVRTLTRQTKPNPLVIGEPGTGKTALVEGLAQHIVQGNVPPSLKDAKIIELSLASVVAGTQYRGEFEKRLELIIDELSERKDVILFLDEFHLAVGAGAASGSMDAANVLKPALARGEFRCIAATTLREYRKHVEPDAALSRRFQTIVLDQPDREATLAILGGIKERFERHHGLVISDEAIRRAVDLSDRYDPDRNQPDKAIDLLDDACTRVTMLSVSESSGEEGTELTVTGEHVAIAISDRTGIPLARLTDSEFDRLANLEKILSGVVKGQPEAVQTITNALREIRLGLRDENRPNGVFLFTGPTGVGKTALAECLAKEYFGLDEALIRVDLSEYTEPHNISRLIGAPPGYVGHDEQGQLTRSLRTRPHSLVLLDEFEKAHPQVFDIFLQVFGSGRLTDGRGEVVDCRQAMFVMTSNAGAEAYGESHELGFHSGDRGPRARIEAVHEACRKHFRPELLNRIDRIVCFNPMTPKVMREILGGLIVGLQKNLSSHDVTLDVSDEAREALVKKAGTDFGVPPLQRLLRERVLNRVTQLMVSQSSRPLTLKVVVGQAGIEVQIES
jgi:ATP-dependent Clp protease ATP-binding subunit ClpC